MMGTSYKCRHGKSVCQIWRKSEGNISLHVKFTSFVIRGYANSLWGKEEFRGKPATSSKSCACLLFSCIILPWWNSKEPRDEQMHVNIPDCILLLQLLFTVTLMYLEETHTPITWECWRRVILVSITLRHNSASFTWPLLQSTGAFLGMSLKGLYHHPQEDRLLLD